MDPVHNEFALPQICRPQHVLEIDLTGYGSACRTEPNCFIHASVCGVKKSQSEDWALDVRSVDTAFQCHARRAHSEGRTRDHEECGCFLASPHC